MWCFAWQKAAGRKRVVADDGRLVKAETST